LVPTKLTVQVDAKELHRERSLDGLYAQPEVVSGFGNCFVGPKRVRGAPP
jgi:hypothetical protein